MKKLYLFAATLAAAAAMTSCSENDIAEMVNNQSSNSADAFSVSVGLPDDVTKGAVADITTTTFNKFLLTGLRSGAVVADDGGVTGGIFQGTNDGESMKSVVFSLSDGQGATSTWTNTGGLFKWTGDNENGTFNFYAVSDNTNARPNGVQFSGVSDASTSTIVPVPTFKYTLRADVDEQKDLLVANKVGHTKADGTVVLNFDHALAKINLTVSLDDDVMKGSRVLIKEIRLHGLNTQATYTFSETANNTGTWTAKTSEWGAATATTAARDVLNLNYKKLTGDDVMIVDSKSPRVKETYESLYVIPETHDNMLPVWNFQDGEGITDHPEYDVANTAYIEVECRFIYDQEAGKKRTLAAVWGTTDEEKATGFIVDLTESSEYEAYEQSTTDEEEAALSALRTKIATLRSTYGFTQFYRPITEDFLAEPFASIVGLESFSTDGLDVDDDGFYYADSNPVEDHTSAAWNNMLTADAICSSASVWPEFLNPSWSVMLPVGIGTVDYSDAINTEARDAEYVTSGTDNGTEILYLPLKLKNFLDGSSATVDNGLVINHVYNYNIKLDSGAIRVSKTRDGKDQYGFDLISGEVEVQ